MDSIDIKGFGQIIKEYRKENKLTQERFGKMINKKQETISNYEKGLHYPNDAEEIKVIARILNQPASYILDSIEYSRRGVIEENKALLFDLDKSSNIENLQKRYTFLMGGKEVTEEELKEALEFIKIKRLMKRDEN